MNKLTSKVITLLNNMCEFLAGRGTTLDNLPDTLQHSLFEDTPVEVSNWVRDAIDKAVKLIIAPHEDSLARKLIELAFQAANDKKCSLGMSLAAAFDLLVAAEYYKNVTHKGWYYCPNGEPLLFYPYTNACPRCVLSTQFFYEQANKPGSGTIGQATSRLLSVFLALLFARYDRRLRIYRGKEPIDMLIYDEQEKTVLFSEVKASPLTTPALVVRGEEMTDTDSASGEAVVVTSHSKTDNALLSASETFLFLPIKTSARQSYRLVSLGTNNAQTDKTWAYKRIEHILDIDTQFFSEYLSFWIEAFNAYETVDRNGSSFFWLTNACGQPNPRPSDWPKRSSGESYVTVSDGKTSVGMDRTDDIKKGIYQVLKLGAESKPTQSGLKVKTTLLSNIHAVRHYKEYLTSLEDVVWALDKTEKKNGRRVKQVKKASDLPSDTDIYNLFDGILSFTESHIHDEWIERNFPFYLVDDAP